MNGNGKYLLGLFLTDHVLIQDVLDLHRLKQLLFEIYCTFFLPLFFHDVVAQFDAFITDIDGRTSNDFFDFILRFSAEGASQRSIFQMGHGFCLVLGFSGGIVFTYSVRWHCLQFAVMHHRIDDAISLGFIARKIIITLGIGCDFFYILPCMRCQDVV